MRHIRPFPVHRDRYVDLYDRLMPKVRFDLLDWRAPDLTEPFCWIFTGAWTDGKGFRKVRFDSHALYVHRAMYEILVGTVPEGLVLDHLCRRRACCCPDHLEPVTVLENTLRGNGAWMMYQTPAQERIAA